MTVAQFATATFPPGQVEISFPCCRDFATRKTRLHMTTFVIVTEAE
jgi:hypothetical protein